MDNIIIKGLKIFAYHGVNPEEKRDGQYFILDIILSVDISTPCLNDNVADTVNYSSVTKAVTRAFTERSYDLIERAAQCVCDEIFEQFSAVKEIEITLKKPSAPVKADFDYMAVKLHRTRQEQPAAKTAILSLGSNLGNREENLKNAIKALDLLPDTSVVQVSSFYRTPPFGVGKGHNEYINCCVKICTYLSPKALLGGLLGIEAASGRIRQENDVLPRTLDIDLLLYEGFSCNDSELCVPHPRMSERAFVLVPLCDLYPECKSTWFDLSLSLATCDKSGIVRIEQIPNE